MKAFRNKRLLWSCKIPRWGTPGNIPLGSPNEAKGAWIAKDPICGKSLTWGGYHEAGVLVESLLTSLVFFRQFLRSPRMVGSVCPSGGLLANTLTRMALETKTPQGLIVDLGAGTGAVSRQLLEHGVPPERILAVDISAHFRKIFAKHCPNVKLYIAEAKYLGEIVATYFPSLPIQAVISSLPLRNMPDRAIADIMLEIRSVLLNRGGFLIQYTYALWMDSFLTSYGFAKLDRKYVFVNFPPALAEKYYVQKQQ